MIHVNIIFCLKRCSQIGGACFLFFLWCQCIQPIQACYSMALLALFHTCARSGGCGAQHVGTQKEGLQQRRIAESQGVLGVCPQETAGTPWIALKKVKKLHEEKKSSLESERLQCS